ncbi:MAG: mandelate racemase/muconate lactonizing enzyme family protein [Chloroflexota bacterium]|nr:MAG: mandelate racemase/muconate lactonizing enzyme family protein [Chloroflexota bacterium]
MRITDIRAVYRDRGPGAHPNSDGGYANQRRVFGYVEVLTDEGISGFCPGAAHPSVVETDLKPTIVGMDPRNIEDVWSKLWQGWRHPKMDDVMALSKVDIAIWDLVGKALGQPVWRLLGGARQRVKAYGAGGMYQPGKGINELVAEMADFANHGFTVVKMKVGRLSFAEDLARVRAVGAALGSSIGVMIDANHAWTSSEAIRFTRAVGEENIFWLEEPVDPWDYRGCAEVARALDVPVATGENVSTRYAFRDMIDARGCDIVQADALYCGGLTEWRKIAHYAAAHSLPMAPHGSAHVGAHCVGGVSNGMIVEVGMYAGRVTSSPSVVAPLVVTNGEIDLGETPGIGWQIDRDAIRWYESHDDSR